MTQSQPPTCNTISVSQRSQVSQLFNINTSIMGERSEQAQNRQSRLVGAVTTQRHIGTATPKWSCGVTLLQIPLPTTSVIQMLTCAVVGRIFWQHIALLTSMLMMHPLSLSKMFLALQERRHLTTPFQGTHSSFFFTNHCITARNSTIRSLILIRSVTTAFHCGIIHSIRCTHYQLRRIRTYISRSDRPVPRLVFAHVFLHLMNSACVNISL